MATHRILHRAKKSNKPSGKNEILPIITGRAKPDLHQVISGKTDKNDTFPALPLYVCKSGFIVVIVSPQRDKFSEDLQPFLKCWSKLIFGATQRVCVCKMAMFGLTINVGRENNGNTYKKNIYQVMER